MNLRFFNKKREVILIIILVLLFLSSLVSSRKAAGPRLGLQNSAHDLTNESTAVCFNCHWMHQRADTITLDYGWDHALISSKTLYLCFVCHGSVDPNADEGKLWLGPGQQNFLPAHFFDTAIRQTYPRSAVDTTLVSFPGQDGLNPYNIYSDYREIYVLETATNYSSTYNTATSEWEITSTQVTYETVTGSYHLRVSDMIDDYFECFDCHNHGVFNTAYAGGRLPKLLWSRAKNYYNTLSISISDRKDKNKYYAKETFCLSCHSRNAYPDKWNNPLYDTSRRPPQKNDTGFLASPHSKLERYGIRTYDSGAPESTNPYGPGNDISCLVCHSIHASTYPDLMRGNYNENTMCLQCHQIPTGGHTFDTVLDTIVYDSQFAYKHESTGAVNYITTSHIADKTNYNNGHGRTLINLNCSKCHEVHGTGHYKMLKDTVSIGLPQRDFSTVYNMTPAEIAGLDDEILHRVSNFCAGTCHNVATKNKLVVWWKDSAATYVDNSMPSVFRGKGKFDSSKHAGARNTFQEARFPNYDLLDCVACHDSHGTEFSAITWANQEDLCFQCHNDTSGTSAPGIEKYFNTATYGRSHHPVKTAEQNSTRMIECINCHNPHIATKADPTIYPYNWSSPSGTEPKLNLYGSANVKDHEGRVSFCATCHSDIYRDADFLEDRLLESTGDVPWYFPAGVRITSAKRVADKFITLNTDKSAVIPAGLGHFKSFPGLIDCLNCHTPHGSRNPFNIRDTVYTDPVDSCTDTFVVNAYIFNTAFYFVNTWESRAFCYSPNGETGCHTPQYLETPVVFPAGLAVDSSHHNARKVPYGPRHLASDTGYLTASFYIDEHDPYYDTSFETPASGIIGCSICHYQPHNPTPDYWYNLSGALAAQYCLDCHRPPVSSRPAGYVTAAKYYGGAPSKYELPFIDFVSTIVYPLSTTYVSRHLDAVSIGTDSGMNAVTTGYCKNCHGEHTYNTVLGYHDIPGDFVKNTYNSKNYESSSLFCLGCHRGVTDTAHSFGAAKAPNVDVTYEVAGHGRLSALSGSIDTYCFDCHTKHSSSNPYLLRTTIRDLITYNTVADVINRDLRPEELNSVYTKTVNVKLNGLQYVCFACHTEPGDTTQDLSENPADNARYPHPGTSLWLGKDVYENAGHGNTFITPYVYVETTYYGTATTSTGGMKCSWCHEPHGRGVNSANSTAAWYRAFNSTYNDDMLRIEGSVALCYKCHDRTLVAPGSTYVISNIKTLFDDSTIYSRHDIYSTDEVNIGKITCLNCHNPHTGSRTEPVVVADKRTVVNFGDDDFCTSCHGPSGAVPVFPSSPKPDVKFPIRGSWDKSLYGVSAHGDSAYIKSVYGTGARTVFCRTCHKPHGTAKKDLLREVYDFNQDGQFGEYNYETIKTDFTTYASISVIDYKDEEVCFGCHRSHTEPDWNTAWTGIPDIRKFYYNSAGGYARSYHNVFASTQIGPDKKWGSTSTDDTQIECASCHNQHIATKAKPVTDPDNPEIAMGAYGDEGITFCLRCHDNDPPPGILGLTDEKYKNIQTEYDPDADGVFVSYSGHYRQRDGKQLECRVCHSMHGSNFDKQIRDDVIETTADTSQLIRYMWAVKLDSSNPFSGRDNLALSSFEEMCLSCHSGKTQFWDGGYGGTGAWRDIPLPPPSRFLDPMITNASYHPDLNHTTDIYFDFADPVRKPVKSVYDSLDFNINTAVAFDTAGCGCHGAHNPFKSSTSEFGSCFNCHDNLAKTTPDIKTAFSSTNFTGWNSPLVKDDNTLLLLHLDVGYEGMSKELPVEKYGLKTDPGRYGMGVLFDTSNSDSTRLTYPLWTSISSGASSIGGIMTNDSSLTLRFDNNLLGDGSVTDYNASGVTYTEGKFGGSFGAVYVDSNDTLNYNIVSSISQYENTFNSYPQGADITGASRWERIENKGASYTFNIDTTAGGTGTMAIKCVHPVNGAAEKDYIRYNLAQAITNLRVDLDLSIPASNNADFIFRIDGPGVMQMYTWFSNGTWYAKYVNRSSPFQELTSAIASGLSGRKRLTCILNNAAGNITYYVDGVNRATINYYPRLTGEKEAGKYIYFGNSGAQSSTTTWYIDNLQLSNYGTRRNIYMNASSIEAWVKITGAGTGIQNTSKDRYVFLYTTSNSKPYRNSIFIKHSSLNLWEFGRSDETGNMNAISTPDNLTYGWHHFAATWNNTDKMLKLYIDGQLRAEEGATLFPKSVEEMGISPSNQNFWIGTNPIQECADAAIDDFQLTNYIKTADQILADFNGQSERNLNEKRGTISLWLKPLWDGNDSVNHSVFENYYDTGNYLLLQKTSGNQLKFTIMGKGVKTELSRAVDSTNLPKDTWSHLAVSWEELTPVYANMNLYLNGVKVDSTITASMMTAPGLYLYFGSRRDNSEMLSGAIDEVWITDIGQDSSDIDKISSGFSNVENGSTPSPSTSYLPDPLSLKLLLNYDTTFNGADGEPAETSGVSYTAGKFGSGALFTGNAYARYQAGVTYSNLTQFFNRKFDSTFGVGIVDSTGVTFTAGFLGGSLGGVLVDSADVLSYTAGTRLIQGGEPYIALWRMDNNWNDVKGLSNGTPSGTVSFIDSTFLTNIANFKQAGNFNGSANGYVSCGNGTGVRFGTSSFAISVWLRPASLSSADDPARARFLAKSEAAASPTGSYWAAELDTTGAVYLKGTSSDSTAFLIKSTPGAVTTGVWQNITFNLHQGTKRGYVYVNGTNKTIGGYADLSSLRGNLDVAARNFTMNSAWGEYNGLMDDLALYKTTLTEGMILFHSGVLNVAKNGTFQAWINYDSTTRAGIGDRYMLRIDTASTNNISLYRRSSDTTWILRTSDSVGDSTEIKITDGLSYGWHNLAATWDNASLNFYIDGFLKDTKLNPKLPDSTMNVYYLGYGGQSNTQINAVLDECLLDTTLTSGSLIASSITPQYYNYNASSGTIEMWMKPYNWTGSDTSKVRYLFDINSNGNSSRISMYYDTDRTIKFSVYDSTGLLGLAAWNASGIDSTTFRHYAGTWNEYNVNLYVDGAQVDTASWPDRRPSQIAPVIYIGSNSYMKNQADAVIDEVRIFDNMRSPAMISADAGNLYDYKSYYANSFDPYEGGSRHPINYDTAQFTGTNIKYMECLKCHLQLKPDTSMVYHRLKVVEFVDVASDTSWNSRKPYAIAPNNTSKRNVTLFCLSCHMMDSTAEALDTTLGSDSPYRFNGPNKVYGGRPVQLRPLDAFDSLQAKPGGGYYYPIDTASAHFDSSFGTATAFGGLSCTDCHDPHGSINKSMLQDFEEYKDGRDYNRDGNTTRVIMYSDRENVRNYQLNEEKFCYFCHDGTFNTTGMNAGWQMKNIKAKFSYQGAHHMVDDSEQAANDVRVECTNCHNPHTARRDKVVLNPKTGQRAAVANKNQMNAFCLGCHADMDGAILPTSWSEGVKFPGYSLDKNGPEWSGKDESKWNEFNKASMAYGNYNFGNKHYYSTLEVSCAECHDPHGTSNYRMLVEKVINAFNTTQTTYVYGLKLMPQIKPDGRRRYEVYSTAFGGTTTNYSINQFCAGCHKAAMGYDVDYPGSYVYPGKGSYDSWDFGDKITSTNVNEIRYDTIRSEKAGVTYYAPDVLGKDKDCDYCHNPHSSDSTRIHMVRDNVPQDLDRFSANYGDRIDSSYWFKEGYAATGIDFCLSKSCHVTNRQAKLGPRDYYYAPGSYSYWWYKPYDQFNLIDYDKPGALGFSNIRAESFEPDYNLYTSARVSKHPIVTYDEFVDQGNTLICLSCHTPHGSPGNTILAQGYGGSYDSFYPQDNAGLRRAYYRRIYWYPMTFYKSGAPSDVVLRSGINAGRGTFANWNWSFNNYDGLSQNVKNLSIFQDANPMNYSEAARKTNVPSGANDICFMCHPKADIIGEDKLGDGIDTTRTRFVGHEAVIDGAKIGQTNYGSGSDQGGPGLNFDFNGGDYHKFTCSACHGPHAATNEKLLTMKCFAYNKRKPGVWGTNNYLGPTSPRGNCHPYDNGSNVGGSTDWGNRYLGWKRMTDITKTDLVRPTDTISRLYIYFNTTGAYDTVIPVPELGLPVKSNDLDVVLAWKTVYDSNETKWVDHYNIYRGDSALSKENKTHKAQPIRTWKEWGYNLLTKVYDTNSTRPASEYGTLYTIDPSIGHKLNNKYYYMVVAADAADNEVVIPRSQDTTGVYYSSDLTPPRPVTTIRLLQETIEGYNYRIRIMWQDPGDNLVTKGYNLYSTLLAVGVTPDTALLGSLWANRLDTSSISGFNTDNITGVNFRDYYETDRLDSASYDSASLGKIFYVGITAYDSLNNTTAVFGTRYIKILDPSPEYVTTVIARPEITANKTGLTNSQYDVKLSWSVPRDNGPIAAFRVYRRLGAPINQFSIDDYNLRSGNEVECITTLTGYNSLSISQYAVGDTVGYIDNIAPYNVYYYAVSSMDKFDTNANNWDVGYDTVYNSVLGRYVIYREAVQAKYNTRLLDPVSSSMKVQKQNTKFIFSFPSAGYNTANFKQYNFYRRFQSATVWTKSNDYQTAITHGLPGDCNQGNCHISKNPSNHNWDTSTGPNGCTGCHSGNARGEDNVDTSYPTGDYSFAASILFNTSYIVIDGFTTKVDNLEAPINTPATKTIGDLTPPLPITLYVSLIPKAENKYNSVQLTWSGGTDPSNFKGYVFSRHRENQSTGAYADVDWTGLGTVFVMSQTTLTQTVPPAPDGRWQSDNSLFGNFQYTYKVVAWDSADNFSNALTTMITRPPTVRDFSSKALTEAVGIKLSWSDMLVYSEVKNLGDSCYQIYGRPASSVSDKMTSTFVGTTLTLAPDVKLIGTKPARPTGTGYSKLNQIIELNAYVTASSSQLAFPVENARDGSLASFWSAAPEDTTSSAYIEFDLGTAIVVGSIIYSNNPGDAVDTTQGFTIRYSDSTSNSTKVWDTLVTMPVTTTRRTFTFGREYGLNQQKTTRYVQVTNFSNQDSTWPAGIVNELEVKYPSGDDTTEIIHNENVPPSMPIKVGQYYAYGIILQNLNNTLSQSVYLPAALSSIDFIPPNSVNDLVAWGIKGISGKIYLKWTDPGDNAEVTSYRIWRHEGNDYIYGSTTDFGRNRCIDTLYTTASILYYTDNYCSVDAVYFYAIQALDSTNNSSPFTGRNYTANARPDKSKDTLPPEPVTLLTCVFGKTDTTMSLTWNYAVDRSSDYTSTGQISTEYNSGVAYIKGYGIYRVDYSLDSTPFANEIANVKNRDTFDSGGGWNTAGTVDSVNVAKGWSVGTWGGGNAPRILPEIVTDAVRGSKVQKLTISGYVGNSKERVNDSTNPFIRTAGYIKSAGYEFETSRSIGEDSSSVHYVFGVWLKAEGQGVGDPYNGYVYLDAGTKFGSGNNESTYVSFGRREIYKPVSTWAYYRFNFMSPAAGLSDSTQNGVMIWATNNGRLWLDNARLVKLGNGLKSPYPNEVFLTDYDIVLGNSYYYAITARDQSYDPSWNESDYANILSARADVTAPVFDTAYFNPGEVDLAPWNPSDGNKTGNTRTVHFMPGVTPVTYRNPNYDPALDSDNIFSNEKIINTARVYGDCITLQFRMLDGYSSTAEMDILETPTLGALGKDFKGAEDSSGIDSYRDASFDEKHYGSGLYSFAYLINVNNTRPDTPYDTVNHRYSSTQMYKLRVLIKDRNGNGPYLDALDNFKLKDAITTDNNPDSTYLCILDNTTPSWPQ